TVKDTAIVALPRAAASVPDGMAAAALVGVNPIHGLYAGFAGPIIGGLTASTKLMVITTTSAASLAAYSALQAVPKEFRLQSLFLLTAMAGGLMLLAGFFGLGRFTAFVSHSVMTGFLTGVAVSILLGQVPDLVGVTVESKTSVGKAFEVLLNPGSIHLPSLLVGLGALILLALIPSTGLAKYAALTALIVPSILVAFLGYLDDVAVVRDSGEIARGFPLPVFPPLGRFSFALLAGAFAVAAIVLVQGAGVAQSYPNPDRTRTDQNSDFMSQGWANVVSGLFRGIPVGGSVSQTALNVSVGAKDRWASVMSGVWLLVVLVLLSGLVGRVAIPTLAAILIVASIGAIRPREIAAVWQSGPQSQIAMVTTFVATLYLPVAAAVGIGVALSLLLSINREAQDVRVVRLMESPDGAVVEADVPSQLESNAVVILNVYGSLFYAGARTFEAELPAVGDAVKPVVVVRMRGRTVMGATAFSVLSTYAGVIAERGGRLYLSGVSPSLVSQFEESGRIESIGPIRVVEATETLGESTRSAVAEAEGFLLREAVSPDSDVGQQEPWSRRLYSRLTGLWSHRPDA
ncbi:MAG: SulP family inorganic anion transporter, partial [Acidimicrobiia bacterium]